ncbi:hypothetical protein GP486_008421, partial [Trichoglossum hirsutum]
IVAIILAFNFALLFFFVPETFWDRTPRPKKRLDRRTLPPLVVRDPQHVMADDDGRGTAAADDGDDGGDSSPSEKKHSRRATDGDDGGNSSPLKKKHSRRDAHVEWAERSEGMPASSELSAAVSKPNDSVDGQRDLEAPRGDDLDQLGTPAAPSRFVYTEKLKKRPPLTFAQTLRPWNGRLRRDSWFRAAVRPLILYAYPSVLWSALVYSLSVGWLIVLSESVATVYQHNPYNFSPLTTGLVYLSPFIGGILGTVVAGRVSDIIVRFMARRNDGVYEPEFRLVMAALVALCTSVGLMGFGWSANVGDKWIVPTIFFGVISFGCTLGSTTAITFCVDSYRQYAGEALVTLNFSK